MKRSARVRAIAGTLVLAAVAGACGSGGGSRAGSASGAHASATAPPTLVVMGDAASAPPDGAVPVNESWPQWFFRTALDRHTVLVNLAVRVAPAHLALRLELPFASRLHPTVAAILIGFVDVAEGNPPGDFAVSLEELVRGSRTAGAHTVLLATLPDEVKGVAPYNKVIADVARRGGAVLVDLTPLSVAFVDDQDVRQEAVTGVPTRASQRAIADAFTAAYRAATASATSRARP